MKRQLCFKGKIVVDETKTERGLFDRMCKGSAKEPGRILNFYWQTGDKKIWLFSQKYNRSIHKAFMRGMRDFDIRNYNKWDRNPRLDKTIEKIPMYVAYASREIA